jgi:membrane fusion protein (multidrug efflux system)
LHLLASATLLAVLAAAGARAQGPPALVATRQVAPAPYEVTLSEKVGLLEAGEHRELAFLVSGRLVTLAGAGARVAAGDPVATLGAELEKARLRQAELRLREARRELARVRGLRAADAASKKLVESAETAALLRLAERDAVQEELARRTLVAPFAGVVAETRFDPDEVVTPGAPVALFMDLVELRLEVGVPGYEVSRVVAGARVSVTVPALPGQRFVGAVHRVAPAAAEGRHLFEVEIRVPNPEGRLRPGMGARARIVTESLPAAVVVPLEAIVERDGAHVVFFVEDRRARAVPVDGAILQGDHLVLRSAPSQGELVVHGQRDLRDGAPVRVDNTVLAGAPRDGPEAASAQTPGAGARAER